MTRPDAKGYQGRGEGPISLENLAELEETISVLSDPQALADIREADAASATSDVLHGVNAVRALRP